MSRSNTKPKVVKVIWSLLHYRVPVFRQLSQNPNMDFTLCAGDNPESWGGAMIASASDIGTADGVNWHKVKSIRLKFWPFKWYEWQPGAVKYIWKNNPDAIICLGNYSLSNCLIRIVCKLKDIPLIDWTIGVMGPETGLKWAIRKFYLNWCKAHLLYGEFARDWYINHGFKKEACFVVRNSLDFEKQVIVRDSLTAEDVVRVREEFGVDNSEARLLVHPGRVELKKNLPLLFEAMKILKGKGRKLKLLLIGKGREEEVLRKLAKDLGLEEEVVFFGECYEEEKIGLLFTASDLTVVPGVTGLISMHSLVYGTPILTRYNTAYAHGPEVEAVVEGKTGGYFEDGNVEDLVEKMEYLLYEEPCKPRMIDACKAMIEGEFNPAYQEKVVIKALNYVLPADKQILS